MSGLPQGPSKAQAHRGEGGRGCWGAGRRDLTQNQTQEAEKAAAGPFLLPK